MAFLLPDEDPLGRQSSGEGLGLKTGVKNGGQSVFLLACVGGGKKF